MRRVGVLEEEAQARHLSWYLSRLGIENSVRRDGDLFEIWVPEHLLHEAAGYLAQYRRPAPRVSRETALRLGPQPLTVALIMVCVALYFLLNTGFRGPILDNLFLRPEGLNQGQWWRLLTPVFLHFSVLHIIFNMLWLYVLGNMIEMLESRRLLIAQVLIIGVGSNLAQFSMGGPDFGGMSGVIYGLLGYIWMRAWRVPTTGYFINNEVIAMMLIWLVVCFTGWLGPVANTAHVSGLLLGVLWGLLRGGRG